MTIKCIKSPYLAEDAESEAFRRASARDRGLPRTASWDEINQWDSENRTARNLPENTPWEALRKISGEHNDTKLKREVVESEARFERALKNEASRRNFAVGRGLDEDAGWPEIQRSFDNPEAAAKFQISRLQRLLEISELTRMYNLPNDRPAPG